MLIRAFISILLVFIVHSAWADLLISPTRVALDERQRQATVTLINSGNVTRTYRVGWSQYVALPEGGYREYTDEEKRRFAGLERFTRISPKQVTLTPGERQSIKILLRQRQPLPAGEYRSHLTLTALPPAQLRQEQESGQTNFKLNMLLSYTFPVLYRVGTPKVSVALDRLSIVTRKENNATFVRVDLSHNDMYSTTGRLVALWQPQGGEQRQVGLLNGYNFYPEIKQGQTEIHWPEFRLEPGTLTVIYEGQQEFQGTEFARKSLTITKDMIP